MLQDEGHRAQGAGRRAQALPAVPVGRRSFPASEGRSFSECRVKGFGYILSLRLLRFYSKTVWQYFNVLIFFLHLPAYRGFSSSLPIAIGRLEGVTNNELFFFMGV
jgi:hypothetical protein